MINLLKEVSEVAQINWTQVIIQTLATVGLIVGGSGFWQYKQTKLQAKKDAESKKENIDILNKQFKALNEKFDGVSEDLTKIKKDVELLQEANEATVAYREARNEQDKKHSAEREALIKALTDTMRSRLLDFFERCHEKGYYTVEERDVYHPLYERYKSEPFNGNGVMDELHDRIVGLPMTKEEKEELEAQTIEPAKSKTTKNARNRKTARA